MTSRSPDSTLCHVQVEQSVLITIGTSHAPLSMAPSIYRGLILVLNDSGDVLTADPYTKGISGNLRLASPTPLAQYYFLHVLPNSKSLPPSIQHLYEVISIKISAYPVLPRLNDNNCTSDSNMHFPTEDHPSVDANMPRGIRWGARVDFEPNFVERPPAFYPPPPLCLEHRHSPPNRLISPAANPRASDLEPKRSARGSPIELCRPGIVQDIGCGSSKLGVYELQSAVRTRRGTKRRGPVLGRRALATAPQNRDELAAEQQLVRKKAFIAKHGLHADIQRRFDAPIPSREAEVEDDDQDEDNDPSPDPNGYDASAAPMICDYYDPFLKRW
ncbi:hypothetical protein DFH09DRAFT_1325672 [Mycena vulgaris]|nr:hypothetical protein DFH09DRAFT_1325672 [Mycena vulgaris]